MIQYIYIKNLAIIDELTIDFIDGLNILTGQTGSGKSIIINAVDLLLGMKFNKNLMKTGKSQCVVEGGFNLNEKKYIIRRVFSDIGQSKSFINEAPVSLNDIKKISINLVDFHGQHSHQKLLNIENHIEYLDAYGDYQTQLNEIEKIFNSIVETKNKINKIKTKQRKSEEKKELFLYQLNELKAMNLIEGMDEKVEAEYKAAIKSKDIKETFENLIFSLESNNNSILDQLDLNKKKLERLLGINSTINQFVDRIKQIIIDVKDFYDEAYDYNSQSSIDNQYLDEISEKFEATEMIKRKYGGSISSAIEYKKHIELFLNESDKYLKEINELEILLQQDIEKYDKISDILSNKRLNFSRKINKAILPILKDIGMKNTIIDFEVSRLDTNLNFNGKDSCIIKISTNIGESLKPLNEIVSGGELSRIMLAIKMLLQDKDPVDTIIFDEVDSGISGRIAEKVGSLIESLGKNRQVVCITHLSQIACKGDYHLLIDKKNDKKFTNVYIEKLTKNKRILEIAGLISGSKITENAKSQARQLLLN